MATHARNTQAQRPALRLVSTRDVSREDWLEVSKQDIGASDAAAACGISPYQSRLELWMIKTGRDQELPDPTRKIWNPPCSGAMCSNPSWRRTIPARPATRCAGYVSPEQLAQIAADILLGKLAGQENLTRPEDVARFLKLPSQAKRTNVSRPYSWTTSTK